MQFLKSNVAMTFVEVNNLLSLNHDYLILNLSDNNSPYQKISGGVNSKGQIFIKYKF